jgi:hypothetical protein
VVLAATATGVCGVVEFHDPALVDAFGFPDVLATEDSPRISDRGSCRPR